MAVGVRRTTLADVARRAGLSRMTLYRRHPDVQSIIAALIARDLGGVITETLDATASLPTARERVVEAFARTVSLMSESPLVLRILEVDPELLLPYVTDRVGATQRVAIEAIERHVVEGQADGSIRDGDPAAMAACLELAGRSHVFSARATERACDRSTALAELRVMADAYLRPAAP